MKSLLKIFAAFILFGQYTTAQETMPTNVLDEIAPWGEKFTVDDIDLIMFITQAADEIGAVSACSVDRGKIMYACTEMVLSSWPQLSPTKQFQWTPDKAMFIDIDFTQKFANAHLLYKEKLKSQEFSCKDAGKVEKVSIIWDYCKISDK